MISKESLIVLLDVAAERVIAVNDTTIVDPVAPTDSLPYRRGYQRVHHCMDIAAGRASAARKKKKKHDKKVNHHPFHPGVTVTWYPAVIWFSMHGVPDHRA